MRVAAGKFKATCLKLMDDVCKYHTEIVITKHGTPVAKLIPFTKEGDRPLFGYMRNSVQITGDIVNTVGEKWDADADE